MCYENSIAVWSIDRIPRIVRYIVFCSFASIAVYSLVKNATRKVYTAAKRCVLTFAAPYAMVPPPLVGSVGPSLRHWAYTATRAHTLTELEGILRKFLKISSLILIFFKLNSYNIRKTATIYFTGLIFSQISISGLFSTTTAHTTWHL